MSTDDPDFRSIASDQSGAAAPPEAAPSLRLAAAIFLGATMFIGPFFAYNAVLLPARLELIAPERKVALVATLAIVGSIVALLANVLFGAFSDLTRSRLGRRTPWMLLGSVGAFACLLLVLTSTNVAALLLAWCGYQLFLNAIVAPLVAVIPDRVPGRIRGVYSAVYGGGILLGIVGAQIAAAPFVTDPQRGMWLFAVVTLLTGPLFALLAPDASNAHVPRERFSRQTLLRNFVFPTRDARDFYLALAGKLLMQLATYAITGYQLFILTDYIGVSSAEAGETIALLGIVTFVPTLIFGMAAGPFSDRIGRRKAPIIVAALVLALASLLPFFVAEVWAIVVYVAITGMGSGVYSSVDQALNYEVLPDPETAAKDLGILNMANTGGQILGPALTSAVVMATGGYRLVFLAAAAILIVSAALMVPITRSR